MLPASSGVKCEVRRFKPKGGGGGKCSSKTLASTCKNAHCQNPKDYDLSHHYKNLASFMNSEEAGLKL
jgi:hypothetical protein